MNNRKRAYSEIHQRPWSSCCDKSHSCGVPDMGGFTAVASVPNVVNTTCATGVSPGSGTPAVVGVVVPAVSHAAFRPTVDVFPAMAGICAVAAFSTAVEFSHSAY